MKRMVFTSVVVFTAVVVAAAEYVHAPLRVHWWAARYEDAPNTGLTQSEWETNPNTRLERVRIDVSADGGSNYVNLAYGIPTVRGSNTWEYAPSPNPDDSAWLISERVFITVQPLSMLGQPNWVFGPLTFPGLWIDAGYPTVRRGMLNVVRFKAAGVGPVATVGIRSAADDTFSPLLVADVVAGTNNVFYVCPPDFPLGSAELVVQSLDDPLISGLRAVTVVE